MKFCDLLQNRLENYTRIAIVEEFKAINGTGEVRLGKLQATDILAFSRLLEELPKSVSDAGETKLEFDSLSDADRGRYVEAMVDLIKASAVDDEGDYLFPGDEGRAFLLRCDVRDLESMINAIPLLDAEDAAKNSNGPKSIDSPDNWRETSDDMTLSNS